MDRLTGHIPTIQAHGFHSGLLWVWTQIMIKTSLNIRERVSWGRSLPLYLLHFASLALVSPTLAFSSILCGFSGEGLLPVVDGCTLCGMILLVVPHTLDADNILTWFTPTCSLIAPQCLGLLAAFNSCQGDGCRVSVYVC